jgi:hypothetical protein
MLYYKYVDFFDPHLHHLFHFFWKTKLKKKRSIYYARKSLVSLSQANSTAVSNITGGVSLIDMPIPESVALRPFREMAHMLYNSQKHTTRNASAVLYLKLLKLSCSSENIFLRNSNLFSWLVETPVTNMLRSKLKDIITRQEDQGNHDLSQVLIDECIEHLNDSTTPGPGTSASTRDSLHPIFPRCSYTDTVFMDGAKMLWVLFDPRCETKHNGTLSFYHGSDERCRRTPIAQFTGTNFMPFVVPGNKVHFKFTSSRSVSEAYESVENNCGWGYRFQVRPLRGLSWTKEAQIHLPSLEWACWLLEFLLNEVSELGKGTVHNVKVFNAMVAYLRAKGTPYKHRIIALLTQMLRSPKKWRGTPDIKALRGIEKAVFDWCKKHQQKVQQKGGGGVLPRRVMQLIEMSITARVSASDFEDIQKGNEPKSYGKVNPSDDSIPLSPIPEPVLSEMNTDDGSVLIDIVKTTEALYGNTRLPDNLMNHAILVAQNVLSNQNNDTKRMHPSFTVAQLAQYLTDVSMNTSIRNNAWWSTEADLQLVEYVTKTSRNNNVSPSDMNPALLLLSKKEQMLKEQIEKDRVDQLSETQKRLEEKLKGDKNKKVKQEKKEKKEKSPKPKSPKAKDFFSGIKNIFGTRSSSNKKNAKSNLDEEILKELSPYPLLLSEYHRQSGDSFLYRRLDLLRNLLRNLLRKKIINRLPGLLGYQARR